jgi:DNA polymerase-1
MLLVDRELASGRLSARMILQVHDELVLEVPVEEAGPVEALVRRAMEGAAELLVPLDVEVGKASSWADAH